MSILSVLDAVERFRQRYPMSLQLFSILLYVAHRTNGKDGVPVSAKMVSERFGLSMQIASR